MTRWILASASPRRKELLHQMGLVFDVIPAKGEESADSLDPGEYVRALAEHKAAEVFRRDKTLTDPQGTGGPAAAAPDNVCVIGADTIVVCDGEKLGKPEDRSDAARMIRKLQGRSHEVMTGVSLIWTTPGTKAGEQQGEQHIRKDSFCEVTTVHVSPMSEEEIDRYLKTGEADDKAGAYGIQGAFGIHISGIEGDYYNVVGLPIAALYRHLRGAGLL